MPQMFQGMKGNAIALGIEAAALMYLLQPGKFVSLTSRPDIAHPVLMGAVFAAYNSMLADTPAQSSAVALEQLNNRGTYRERMQDSSSATYKTPLIGNNPGHIKLL